MIIAKAPYRISFFGGGSDYPEWSYIELERKLLTLKESTNNKKLINILYGNVENILNL